MLWAVISCSALAMATSLSALRPFVTAGGGRGAAKTHLSTNEAALKQLAVSHELPGLVLEHRYDPTALSCSMWIVKEPCCAASTGS
jgi:hypothetical protein